MKDVVIELRKLAIRRVTISTYNSKGQGKIEVGHRPLLQALRALTGGGKENWTTHLHVVLLADRTTVHAPTGHTPFYMVYGREAILPIETMYPTWRILGWDEVESRGDLLALKARQIEVRDEDITEALDKKLRHREEAAEYWNETHQLRNAEFEKGQLVLAYDIPKFGKDLSKKYKLNHRWLGPF